MIKILNEKCQPTKGSQFSACVDLRSSKDMIIESNQTVLIPLGVSINQDYIIEKYTIRMGDLVHFRKDPYIEFMKTRYIQLMLRSSLSKNLTIANGVGVIDMDYPGEIMIRVHNHSTQNIEVKEGDRIAQMTVLKHEVDLFEIESESERLGGFGSTGTN